MSNPSRGFGLITTHPRSGEQAETLTAGLSTAGQLLVWSMRRWVMAVSCGQAPELALARPYISLGCGDAVPLLDESLTLLSATAGRRLAMRCLPHPTLSPDERLLLQVMRALQRGAEGPARTLAGELMPLRLVRTLCRPAAEYVRVLRRCDLDLAFPVQPTLAW